MAPTDEPFILIVEDDPDQVALMQAAFTKSLSRAKLHFVFSSWEARAYLARKSPYHDWEQCPTPSLIVLNQGRSEVGVLETLKWMDEREGLAKIPVIVFTAPEHARKAHEHRVRRYMLMPDDFGELVVAVREELGLPAVVSTTITSGGAQEHEALSVGSEPGPIEVQGVIPWIADAETWVFTYVGPEAVKLLGYPIEDWYEKGFWAKHIHDDDRDWTINYCEGMSRTKEAYVFDYRMTKKGGGFIWLRDFVRVDSLRGVPVTLRGFMFDISDLDEDEAGSEHRPHKRDPSYGGSDKEPHWVK